MLINSPHELASFIANRRKRLKMSQAQAGERVGLKQQTISAFEIRPDSAQIDTLFRILSALNLDIQLFAKDAPSPTQLNWKEGW